MDLTRARELIAETLAAELGLAADHLKIVDIGAAQR